VHEIGKALIKCVEELSCDSRLYAEEVRVMEKADVKTLVKLLVEYLDRIATFANAYRDMAQKVLYTENKVYVTPAGSLILECSHFDSYCSLARSLADLNVVTSIGKYYYIPNYLISEGVVRSLPINTSEAPCPPPSAPTPLILISQDLQPYAEPPEVFYSWLLEVEAFNGVRISKVVHKVKNIRGFRENVVDECVDVLALMEDGTTLGIKYVDPTRTPHLGFTSVKRLLHYGIDNVYLLHPFVSDCFHRDVVLRLLNRWDLHDVGYMSLDLQNGALRIHKISCENRFIKLSTTIQLLSVELKSSLRVFY